MRRLILVANPAASAFTSGLYRDIVRILTGPFDVTTVWPNGPAESRRAAADAAAEGYDVVVAMGGDGVIHQVAGAIAGTETALGIVPAGTTNVLGRLLGLPVKPRAAAQRIADGGVRELEMAGLAMSGPDGSARDVVMFAAGIGFDAAVVERAEQEPLRKIWFGSLHYARSAFGVAWRAYRNRLPHLRVESHGRRLDAVTALSGSGPAYFFLFTQAMIEAATAQGLAPETASLLARQTALGAARMALESDVDLVELRRRVTSPGGTTERAIASFEQDGLSAAVAHAMQAAAERAAEMAREMG
jgi:diacylglycerol kinase family enzyme